MQIAQCRSREWSTFPAVMTVRIRTVRIRSNIHELLPCHNCHLQQPLNNCCSKHRRSGNQNLSCNSLLRVPGTTIGVSEQEDNWCQDWF